MPSELAQVVEVVRLPVVQQPGLDEQDQRRERRHQVDERADGEALAEDVVPPADRLRQVERQAAVVEVVADQHRPGQGQDDHDDVPLEPDEVAERVRGPVQVQPVEELGQVADPDRQPDEADRLGARSGC